MTWNDYWMFLQMYVATEVLWFVGDIVLTTWWRLIRHP
jgi:hypothetical protein